LSLGAGFGIKFVDQVDDKAELLND